MERAIIHINVADFAVAVERVVDSRLRERPVIIAPEGALRATVYDMSEEAYQAGVHKDMPLRRALRRCPDAVVLPPRPLVGKAVVRQNLESHGADARHGDARRDRVDVGVRPFAAEQDRPVILLRCCRAAG